MEIITEFRDAFHVLMGNAYEPIPMRHSDEFGEYVQGLAWRRIPRRDALPTVGLAVQFLIIVAGVVWLALSLRTYGYGWFGMLGGHTALNSGFTLHVPFGPTVGLETYGDPGFFTK